MIERPQNLCDFVQSENLSRNGLSDSTIQLDDINEDEEFWILDIPKTIDPMQLKDHVIHLGDKSKFKVGNEQYCAISKSNNNSSITCVFRSKEDLNKYSAVNIRPVGKMKIRRKLSNSSKKKLQFEIPKSIEYPKNIKVRHPFFGVHADESTSTNEKKTSE